MRFKILLTVSCILLIVGNAISQQSTPKFLIVSLDGMNSNVWDVAHTPNMDLLVQNATYTYSGLTLAPAYNSTTWSSMLTGVWPVKHKVDTSTFTKNDFDTYPHFFDYIEASGIKTASFVANDSIANQIPSSINHNVSFSGDDQVVAKAADYIKTNQEAGAFFVQLDEVFKTGYGKGFDARRAEYIKAIQYYDEQVGTIIGAVTSRANYENENWMIVVTTNHGGTIEGEIGGKSLEETSPFIIISGDFVRNREFILDILDAEKGKDNAVFLRPGVNEYVKINKKGTKLENMSDFTVELRVKPKDASSDPCIIGDKDWNSGGNPGWLLARQGSSWQFNVADQNRTRKDIDLTSDWTIEDDLWHHIVLSFDKDGDAILYTDGRESARTFLGYGDESTFKSPYDHLALGEDGTLAYANGNNQWKGVYDEVRIFDKVLDSLTIATWRDEKNIEGRHPDWDHIIGYWKFDEHEGKKVIDYSGNEYNGELVGTKRVPANGSITHVDIATTLLAHLGVEIKSEWALDGNIVDLVIPNIVLGTEDVRMETKDVAIYPNPARDRLNFRFAENLRYGDEVTVSVFNLNGEKIQSESLTTGYADISLDISTHSKGYYLYHIQGKTFSYKGKFIINN